MVRVVDDYLIGFDTEQAARTALARLREALWSFNLQLNDQKTGIFRSSTVHREKWQLDFDYIKLAARNIEQQRRDIDHLNELALYHCNATNSERPAIWACRRIAELRYDNRNLGLILDVLFRLSRDFPSCVSHVVEFLINNQARCGHPEHIPRVTSWLMHMISSHIQQFHDAEAAWCLVAAGVFQLHLTERELHPDQGRPGPIVFAIIGLLTAWTGELSAFQVAVARGLQAGGPPLSTLAALIAGIRSQSTLSRVLDNGVTFLEDRIFDAAAIDLRRRTFNRARVPTAEQRQVPGSKGSATQAVDASVAKLITSLDLSYD